MGVPMKSPFGKIRTGIELFWLRHIYEKVVIRKQARDFFFILFGPIYFQTLSAAVRFDLFTLLERHGRMTLADICQHLQLQAKPARILLGTLTAIGLIKKKRVRKGQTSIYKTTLFSKIYLTRKKTYSVLDIVRWYHFIVYRPMFHLYESLKANTNVGLAQFHGEESTVYQRLVHHPDLAHIFQAAMEQISTQANALLGKYVDFSDVHHVLDVGGGNGANLITIIQANSRIRGTLFELPDVCEMAKHHIESKEMSSRIDIMSGDCFETPFPADADCILFCHFLDIWSEQQNRALLRKAMAALPSGGRVIIFDIMEWANGRGPLTAAAGSPYFLALATGDGLIYSAQEYETWLRETGASEVKRQHLPRDHVAVIGIK